MDRRTGEQRVGELVRRIYDAMDERLSREISSQQLNSRQMAAIAFLRSRQDGKTTIGELQAFLRVSHPTVSVVIRKLEARGLVCVEVDAQDRRARILTLNSAASEVICAAQHGPEEMEEMLLHGLSREERAQLCALLERVFDNIR